MHNDIIEKDRQMDSQAVRQERRKGRGREVRGEVHSPCTQTNKVIQLTGWCFQFLQDHRQPLGTRDS
jgi:hypothetical protein